MVHDLVARAVELDGQQFLRESHAHGIGETLSERPGGGLDARRHAHFRVARGLAVQLTKPAQLLHRQVIARQMQQRVQEHRAVAVGEHEPVAVRPVRIGGIMLEEPAPEDLGNFGHAHRQTGMPAFRGFHRVDGEHAQGVGQLGALGGGDLDSCVHAARLFRSTSRRIIGVKMHCIARPIFPPGTTMVFGRLIHELCSIDSR